ncbi:NADH dehydrogenase subunit H [Desulfobulbus propionicus DSM 2032]|jgi:NADH-quinone oxidoreductase subunit H|uniref:NADH-quinone oxidoreductase subunit H n=1 Tax=Desulfobulbus propionicus (strain ATCC 33891 / DSM 2032 / VKM B-1956 / 1pr3) TaxID=577650 RepID=A0A7U4DPL9_DESPD|nr:complex I subunit 1 family protein [Desulfobulbus propionicus]ADW18204.1 NADH dehydrogenase subunit H [Desulfobulbus propionicus DSM 2032]
MSQLDILLLVLRVAFGAFVPLCFIAVLVWMERRGAAFFQDRSGPNRANILGFRAGGLVQNLADAVKLITKEDVIPDHVKHKFYFVLAPVIVFFIALVSFAAIPFADALVINGKEYIMQAIPTDLGILWFLALAGFSVYGIILAGWSSHNKYGILGGLRAAAQVISYEIPMGLAIISLLIVYGTVSLTEMAQLQGQLLFGFIPMWGVVLQPLGAVIFIVAAFAETNRTPFDLAEGESELVAGFHVEYSSMKFGMFFMGEYVALFTSSAIIVTLFFGGFQIPWFATETLVNHARPVTVLMMLLLPVFAKVFAMWISKNNRSHYDRVDDPRVREAQIYIKGLWGLVAAIEIVLFIYLITVSGGVADRILVTILQIITFLVKTTLMCFVYVWVRWTLPRFRYDQLQKLGWQTLLPLSLLNIFVTSAIVVALS